MLCENDSATADSDDIESLEGRPGIVRKRARVDEAAEFEAATSWACLHVKRLRTSTAWPCVMKFGRPMGTPCSE